MDGTRLIDGEFWVPGMNHGKCPGFLKVGPRLPPTVEVIGELTPGWREDKSEIDPNGKQVVRQVLADDQVANGPFLIHGVDSTGTKLTLVNAITTHRRLMAESRHVLQATKAVVGSHLPNANHNFSSFRLRFQQLDSWRSVLVNPAWMSEVTLEAGGSMAFQTSYSPRVWLSGRGISDLTLDGIDRGFARPLVSLFTLATGRSSELLDLQVQDMASDGSWCDVYSGALHLDEGVGERDQYRWLLKPTDLDIRHVGAWLDRVDQLGPLPPGVADLARGGPISLEAQVLQLTTIAEGIHRALFPNESRFDEGLSAQARDAAVAAAAKVFPEAKDVVRSLLAYLHQPSYPRRLEQLAEAVSGTIPEVTGRTSKWKELVTLARNDIAHRLGRSDFRKSTDVDRYMTAAFSLRWLLTALMLLQAGVEPSMLGKRFHEYDEYEFFLKSVKQWQPKIYNVTT